MSKNEVHQHPDGMVFVRTPDGTYADTMENFQNDFGVTFVELPPGGDERVYTQGVRHAIHNSATGNLVAGGDVPWPLGDELIARVQEGLEKQQARKAVEGAAQQEQFEKEAKEHSKRAMDDIRNALKEDDHKKPKTTKKKAR